MTTLKSLICAAALVVSTAAFAQTERAWFPTGDADGQGTLGKRYADAGIFAQEIRHTSHNMTGVGIGANVPVVKGIDVWGGYDYSVLNIPTYSYIWDGSRIGDTHVHQHRASGNIVAFNVIEKGIKPFVSLGLSRTWTDSSGSMGNVFAETRNGWNAAIGAEFPYKWIAVTPILGYHDDFKKSSRSSQAWSYGVEISAWVTKQVGVYASTAFYDQMHTSNDTWVTGAGVRFRF
jgi:hypothetical protein